MRACLLGYTMVHYNIAYFTLNLAYLLFYVGF
nr:MAG TPA: hypothetical protein [Caudoviricetes sp.]